MSNSLLGSGLMEEDFEFPDDCNAWSVGKIAQFCRDNHKKCFRDKDFQPVLIDDSTQIKWKRPSEFLGRKYGLFQDGIEPADVIQGALGDCWLMCVLASMAEFPILVERLFVEESIQFGIFKLKLCIGGMWTDVILDDYFPCLTHGGPKYSRSNGHELWVLLLEKAFAKVHGSYDAIVAGQPHEAMICLTGCPFKYIRFDDSDVQNDIKSGTLWASIRDYDQRKYIMSCSTHGEDHYTGQEKTPPEGLVPGHAYTLLQCMEVGDGGHKLCQIRNPWGRHEWKGAWSDSSPLWTDDLKLALGVDNRNDGLFWMSFEDVVQNFCSINVCMTRQGDEQWREWRAPFKYRFSHHGGGVVSVTMFELTVEVDTNIFLTVHQQDTRTHKAPDYIDVGVTVLREMGRGKDSGSGSGLRKRYEFVASSGNSLGRQNQLEISLLSKGVYIVVPISGGCAIQRLKEQLLNGRAANLPHRTHTRDAALSVHASRGLHLRRRPFDAQLYEEAVELPITHQGKAFSRYSDDSAVIYTLKSGYEGVSYLVRNNHATNHYGIRFLFPRDKCSNVCSHRGDRAVASEFELIVPPKQAKVAHHIAPIVHGAAWSCGHDIIDRWLGTAAAADAEKLNRFRMDNDADVVSPSSSPRKTTDGGDGGGKDSSGIARSLFGKGLTDPGAAPGLVFDLGLGGDLVVPEYVHHCRGGGKGYLGDRGSEMVPWGESRAIGGDEEGNDGDGVEGGGRDGGGGGGGGSASEESEASEGSAIDELDPDMGEHIEAEVSSHTYRARDTSRDALDAFALVERCLAWASATMLQLLDEAKGLVASAGDLGRRGTRLTELVLSAAMASNARTHARPKLGASVICSLQSPLISSEPVPTIAAIDVKIDALMRKVKLQIIKLRWARTNGGAATRAQQTRVKGAGTLCNSDQGDGSGDSNSGGVGVGGTHSDAERRVAHRDWFLFSLLAVASPIALCWYRSTFATSFVFNTFADMACVLQVARLLRASASASADEWRGGDSDEVKACVPTRGLDDDVG